MAGGAASGCCGAVHVFFLAPVVLMAGEADLFVRLKDRQPPLPVVIHTFLPEYPTNLTLPIAAEFLEKKGDTDQLKAVVAEVIEKHYPEGVPAREKTG